MAERYVRVSAGKWRDTTTGKIINSTTRPSESKKAAAKPAASSTKTTTSSTAGYTTEGKTPEQLAKDKEEFTKRAENNGGLEKSPNYQARVDAIDTALKPTSTTTTPTPTPTGEAAPVVDPVQAKKDADQKAIQDRIDYYMKRGSEYGQGIGDKYFSDGALGRIDTNLTPEMADVLAKQKELAETAGERSPQQQALLEQMFGDYIAAKNFTPLELEALDRGRAALSGITPQQQEALLSIQRENVNRDVATRAAAARHAIANSNMSGAAGVSLQDQIMRDRSMGMRTATRDLVAKQIEEQRLARESFNSMTGQFESARANRTNQAANTYGSNLRSAEDSEFGQKATAQSMYAGGQQWADTWKRSGQQYNQAQQGKEVAGRVGAELGGVSAISGMGSAFKAEDLAEQNRQDVLAQQEKDRAWQEQMIAQQNKIMADYLKRYGRTAGV